MSTSKILIVEDESMIAMDIEVRLKRLGFDVAGIVLEAKKVLYTIEKKSPDLILLDINLKGKEEGIDLAEEIVVKFNLPVVFLTAYGDDSTFKKAMVTNPFGYVTKPFKDKDLKHAIEIALSQHHSLSFALENASRYKRLLDVSIETDKDNKRILFVKDGSSYHKIALDDILWIEAYDAYSKVHTAAKMVMVSALLKNLYQKLPQDRFVRVHRSYIVSLDHINRIDGDHILIGETRIPVSRSHKRDLIERLDII